MPIIGHDMGKIFSESSFYLTKAEKRKQRKSGL
jgi:hypothetical protein